MQEESAVFMKESMAQLEHKKSPAANLKVPKMQVEHATALEARSYPMPQTQAC